MEHRRSPNMNFDLQVLMSKYRFQFVPVKMQFPTSMFRVAKMHITTVKSALSNCEVPGVSRSFVTLSRSAPIFQIFVNMGRQTQQNPKLIFPASLTSAWTKPAPLACCHTGHTVAASQCQGESRQVGQKTQS